MTARAAAAAVAVPQPRQRAWLVTAPHEVSRAESEERRPWGMHHVRRDGASTTLCGMPTATWRTFWTLEVAPLDRAACPACANAYGRRVTP